MKVSINGPYEVRIAVDATKTEYGYQEYNLTDKQVLRALANWLANNIKVTAVNDKVTEEVIYLALNTLDYELEDDSDWAEVIAEYYEGKTEDLELWN